MGLCNRETRRRYSASCSFLLSLGLALNEMYKWTFFMKLIFAICVNRCQVASLTSGRCKRLSSFCTFPHCQRGCYFPGFTGVGGGDAWIRS